jgi:hypothetical protein
MGATIYKALNVESIMKIIQAEGIQHIKGRPDCHPIITLLSKLGAGAQNEV